MITHMSVGFLRVKTLGLRDIHTATNGSIWFASPIALSVMKSAVGSRVTVVSIELSLL